MSLFTSISEVGLVILVPSLYTYYLSHYYYAISCLQQIRTDKACTLNAFTLIKTTCSNLGMCKYCDYSFISRDHLFSVLNAIELYSLCFHNINNVCLR